MFIRLALGMWSDLLGSFQFKNFGFCIGFWLTRYGSSLQELEWTTVCTNSLSYLHSNKKRIKVIKQAMDFAITELDLVLFFFFCTLSTSVAVGKQSSEDFISQLK